MEKVKHKPGFELDRKFYSTREAYYDEDEQCVLEDCIRLMDCLRMKSPLLIDHNELTEHCNELQQDIRELK